MGKPILERLFDKRNKNKMTAAEKKAQERELKKEEKKQRRIEEDNIRDDIFDTEELLLKSRWELPIIPIRSSRLPKSVLRNREKILSLKRP